jgi:hypothetical protein
MSIYLSCRLVLIDARFLDSIRVPDDGAELALVWFRGSSQFSPIGKTVVATTPMTTLNRTLEQLALTCPGYFVSCLPNAGRNQNFLAGMLSCFLLWLRCGFNLSLYHSIGTIAWALCGDFG